MRFNKSAHRCVLLTAVMVALLGWTALGWGAASAEVLPACESPALQAPDNVVLFHPDKLSSLEKVDRIPADQVDHTLAVCFGAGCTPARVHELATQRGWRVQATHDSSRVGIQPYQELAASPVAPAGLTAVPGLETIFEPKAQALSGPVAIRQTASRPNGLAATLQGAPGGNFMATLAPQSGGLLRRTLMLFFPLMVLGLGGTAVYIGYRQRPPAPPAEPTESERLSQYVRQQHGRRRHSSSRS